MANTTQTKHLNFYQRHTLMLRLAQARETLAAAKQALKDSRSPSHALSQKLYLDFAHAQVVHYESQTG